MQDNIKKQISSLSKSHCYNKLNELFQKNQLGFSYYSYFLILNKDRNNGLVLPSEFWQSRFSFLFISDTLNSPFVYSFFDCFLDKEGNINEELLDEIVKVDFEQFQLQVKLHRGFKLHKLIGYLSRQVDSRLKSLYKELCFIKEYDDKQSEKTDKGLNQLSEYPIVKTFITICNWNHPDSEKINVFDSGTLVILLIIVDSFLAKVKSSYKPPQLSFDEIAILNKEVIERDEITSEIEKIITELYESINNQIVVDLYCSGYMDFECLSSLGTKLVTNKLYEQYQLNDLKVKIDERYHSSKEILEKFSYLKKPSDKTAYFINFYEKYFSFYGEFSNLFFEVNCFDLYDTLYVIRTIVDNLDLDELISVWSYDDFCKLFANSFSKIKNHKLIRDNLVFDLERDCNPNILFRPFVKIGNLIFSLNGFLRNRSWNIIYLNRIIEEADAQKIGNLFEKSIESVFTESKFAIAHKRDKITITTGESTDIDLLAHRNGNIFVIQAKFSKIIEDFSFISFLEHKRISEDACRQMDISLKWIDENWAAVSGDFKISIPKENVNIIPLIVTNYYDGDGILLSRKYPKISLLQLYAIFNNEVDKLDLVSLFEYVFKMRDKIKVDESEYPILFSSPEKLEGLWKRSQNPEASKEKVIF